MIAIMNVKRFIQLGKTREYWRGVSSSEDRECIHSGDLRGALERRRYVQATQEDFQR